MWHLDKVHELCKTSTRRVCTLRRNSKTILKWETAAYPDWRTTNIHQEGLEHCISKTSDYKLLGLFGLQAGKLNACLKEHQHLDTFRTKEDFTQLTDTASQHNQRHHQMFIWLSAVAEAKSAPEGRTPRPPALTSHPHSCTYLQNRLHLVPLHHTANPWS